MKLSRTERGFHLGEFKDANGVDCSIQDSSLATEAAIWFGVECVNPQRMTEEGLVSVPCPPFEGTNHLGQPNSMNDVLFNKRMHLTIHQARLIAGSLRRFLKNGRVNARTRKDRYDCQYSIKKGNDCIIIGCDDANPQVCDRGWRPFPFPEGTIFTTHMHLGREQCNVVLPILLNFVATGTINPK